SRAAGHGQRHLVAVVAADPVAERVQHLDLDGGPESGAGSTVARLDEEAQMVGAGKVDVEGVRSDARQAGRGGGEGVAAARSVDGQVGEGTDTAAGGPRGGAAQGGTGGVAAQRQRYQVAAVAGEEVAEDV